jgi:hypothetical protein
VITGQCANGHERTEQNTSWVRDNARKRTRIRCLDCKRERYTPNGNPAAHELQAQRTTDKHEDIEDLLRFGATFEEILQRSGFSNWKRMKESLGRRGRTDLIEQMNRRRGDVRTMIDGATPGKGTNVKATPSSTSFSARSTHGTPF